MTERVAPHDEIEGRVRRAFELLRLDLGSDVQKLVYEKIFNYLDWYKEMIWPYQVVWHSGRVGNIDLPVEELQKIANGLIFKNKNYGFVSPRERRFYQGDLGLIVWNNSSRPIHGDVMGPSRIDFGTVSNMPPYSHPMSALNFYSVNIALIQDPANGFILDRWPLWDRAYSMGVYVDERIILPFDK